MLATDFPACTESFTPNWKCCKSTNEFCAASFRCCELSSQQVHQIYQIYQVSETCDIYGEYEIYRINQASRMPETLETLEISEIYSFHLAPWTNHALCLFAQRRIGLESIVFRRLSSCLGASIPDTGGINKEA